MTWVENIQKAVDKAGEYRFVRVLSQEGIAVLPFLSDKRINWPDDDWRRKVLRETRAMAKYYPAYLSHKKAQTVRLSDKALTILRLQAEGKSTEEIAKKLFLSVPGVKYYIQDTYKKLGVNGKAAAVCEAKNRGIL